MKEMSLFEAKTHFSNLIDCILTQREEITITRRGEKVAKVIPYQKKREEGIAIILRELQLLSEEIGRVGLTLKDIRQMKEKGRR